MAFTRRMFLTGSGAAAGLVASSGILGRLGLLEGTASAAAATDYRAIVCLFFGGGNDSNNMVIPLTGTGLTNYQAARPSTALLQIPVANMNTGNVATSTALNLVGDPAGTYKYGLHPSMRKLARLFNGLKADGTPASGGRRMAIVANVGPLVVPLANSTDYKNAALTKPSYLFSHSDQVAAWETAIANPLAFPSLLATGWAGRIADKIHAKNIVDPLLVYPEGTSVSGFRTLLQGIDRKSVTVRPGASLGRSSTGNTATNTARDYAMAQLMSLDSGNVLTDEYRDQYEIALADAAVRQAAVTGNPLPQDVVDLFPKTPGTNNLTGLGSQFLQITREILAGQALGGNGLKMKRQVFFASIGGFDTHTNQASIQASKFTEIDDALDAFYQALALLNAKIDSGLLPNNVMPGKTRPLQVTTFTMSDFNRTLKPNSNGGTDHAWGGHTLVLGEPVLGGGKVHGTFPDLALAGSRDTSSEGRWIPSTSVERYILPLLDWMGLATAERPYVVPNLPNFPTAINYMV